MTSGLGANLLPGKQEARSEDRALQWGKPGSVGDGSCDGWVEGGKSVEVFPALAL